MVHCKAVQSVLYIVPLGKYDWLSHETYLGLITAPKLSE